MNPNAHASTSRLPPLRTTPQSSVAFDDRAAAAALLQIKRSPSSAHSPLLPHATYDHTTSQGFPTQSRVFASQLASPTGYFPPQAPVPFHHYVYAQPPSPPRKRKRTPEPAQEPIIDVESDDPVRCICGFDVDDGFTIQCERCHVWQHAACLEINNEDAVPDVYLCERCDPDAHMARGLDYERARRVQSARFEFGSPVKKGRSRADRRRRSRRTSNAHHPPPDPQPLPRPTQSPLASPSDQYVPISSNIVHPSVRPLLQSFAHAWRGVTALSPSDEDGILSPLTTCDPLPAPASEEAADKTFLQPLPPMHPSRPPSYTLRALRPIARRAYVVPYTCAVTPAAAYLREPTSQYAQLGVPKQGVHLIPPPLALCLDARTAGGDARWVRSGCHPNAVLRPVVCDSELDASEEEVTFGVFALRDLKADEEIVLGWEWDDRHVVHELPKMLREGFATPGLTRAMAEVLTTLFSTFTTCACGASAHNCALAQMQRAAEGCIPEPPPEAPLATHRTSHERHHEDPALDLGPLVGARRGLRTVVGGAGGREGVRLVEERAPSVGRVARAFRERRKRKRAEGEENAAMDYEEGLPPKMRKHWIKETLRVLNDGMDVEGNDDDRVEDAVHRDGPGVGEGMEEDQADAQALQSPSTAMAGLSLHPRLSGPGVPPPSLFPITAFPFSQATSASPRATLVSPHSPSSPRRTLLSPSPNSPSDSPVSSRQTFPSPSPRPASPVPRMVQSSFFPGHHRPVVPPDSVSTLAPSAPANADPQPMQTIDAATEAAHTSSPLQGHAPSPPHAPPPAPVPLPVQDTPSQHSDNAILVAHAPASASESELAPASAREPTPVPAPPPPPPKKQMTRRTLADWKNRKEQERQKREREEQERQAKAKEEEDAVAASGGGGEVEGGPRVNGDVDIKMAEGDAVSPTATQDDASRPWNGRGDSVGGIRQEGSSLAVAEVKIGGMPVVESLRSGSLTVASAVGTVQVPILGVSEQRLLGEGFVLSPVKIDGDGDMNMLDSSPDLRMDDDGDHADGLSQDRIIDSSRLVSKVDAIGLQLSHAHNGDFPHAVSPTHPSPITTKAPSRFDGAPPSCPSSPVPHEGGETGVSFAVPLAPPSGPPSGPPSRARSPPTHPRSFRASSPTPPPPVRHRDRPRPVPPSGPRALRNGFNNAGPSSSYGSRAHGGAGRAQPPPPPPPSAGRGALYPAGGGGGTVDKDRGGDRGWGPRGRGKEHGHDGRR